MKKTIPFYRAVSENTGRWVKGWIVVDEGGKHFILSGKYTTRNGVKCFRKIPVKPETVGRLIYSDDKFEIYDGDIIETDWGTIYIVDGEKLRSMSEGIHDSDIEFWVNVGYMNESRIVGTVFENEKI